MQQVLIVVNGMPATGKTTLSKRLATDLSIPRIGKDDLKECLFDHMGTGDLAWSQDIGAATSEMLFTFIDVLLQRQRSFMVESAFFHAFAATAMRAILRDKDVSVLEIYCTADPQVRRSRFIARNESGERHPGHVDHNHYNREETEDFDSKYAPLEIGDILTVDTTVFRDSDYQDVLRTVRERIQGGKV
jgi:predicted kinase